MKISIWGKAPILLIIFILLATLKSFAEDFRGYIYDKVSGEPIEFVNAVLLQTDSVFVAGDVTDEKGYFIMKSVKKQGYILKTSFIGYKTFFKNISIRDSVSEEQIRLEPTNITLGEVVVTSQQPVFQLSQGSLIASVSLSNLKNVGTANDVLQRIPGVIFEDRKISIFGKGTPIIYINNRKVNDQQELDRLLSENISTIELITNPGAKYSAEGRAVLIIKTKSNSKGFSALISEKLRVGTKLGDSENINLSYSDDKINIFASYFHDYRNLKTDDYTLYSITHEDDKKSEHNFHIADRYPANFHSASTGLDWSVNENHSIGVHYQYRQNKAIEAVAINNNISLLNGQIPDTTLIRTLTDDKSNQSLVNAFYDGKFSNNLSAQLNIDYLNNNTKRKAYNSESSRLNTSELDILSKSDYELWAGKLIMGYKSNIGTFEFGGEFNSINGNGSIISHDNISFENSIYSSKEQKAAGFLSYAAILNGYNLRVGLRYEYTKEKSKDDILNNNKVDRKHSELYPSFSISKKLDKVQLSLLFSKKVSRPSITDLYNNTAYVNQYILQKGNPYLTKTDIYDTNIQVGFKMFHINLGYSYLKDPITFYSEPKQNSDYIVTTVTNYSKYQNINAIVNFNHKISFWQPNYIMSVTQPFFSTVYQNETKNYNKLSFSARLYNDFTLPMSIILSANYTYATNRQYMLIDMEHYQRIDLGIRKLFLDNKLKLNLEVWDVFNWMKQNNTLKINNLNLIQSKKRESRFVFLTISYQLNNYKKSYRGTNASKDDINRF